MLSCFLSPYPCFSVNWGKDLPLKLWGGWIAGQRSLGLAFYGIAGRDDVGMSGGSGLEVRVAWFQISCGGLLIEIFLEQNKAVAFAWIFLLCAGWQTYWSQTCKDQWSPEIQCTKHFVDMEHHRKLAVWCPVSPVSPVAKALIWHMKSRRTRPDTPRPQLTSADLSWPQLTSAVRVAWSDPGPSRLRDPGTMETKLGRTWQPNSKSDLGTFGAWGALRVLEFLSLSVCNLGVLLGFLKFGVLKR